MTYNMQVSRVVFKAEEINMRISKVIPQNDHLKKKIHKGCPVYACVCPIHPHMKSLEP